MNGFYKQQLAPLARSMAEPPAGCPQPRWSTVSRYRHHGAVLARAAADEALALGRRLRGDLRRLRLTNYATLRDAVTMVLVDGPRGAVLCGARPDHRSLTGGVMAAAHYRFARSPA